ncbi:MAG: type II toxin-antitoxin system RelE/ParE family toxin [Thermodesulfobacteriota bacterium]
MKFDEPFSERGLESILAGIKEIWSAIFFLENASYFLVSETLKKLWEPQPLVLHKKFPGKILSKKVLSRKELSPDQKPSWLISISNQFSRDIQNIDRKLQRRILIVIGTTYKDSTRPKGDIVKPLGSDFKGLWRYRIGDYRLVYHIDNESKHIILIAFASRGEKYES